MMSALNRLKKLMTSTIMAYATVDVLNKRYYEQTSKF